MALQNFIAASSGGSGAAFSTVVLYPLDIVKTHLNKGADANGVKYKGLLDVITRVLKEHGIMGFYKGLYTRTSQQTVQKFLYYYAYDFWRRLFTRMMKTSKLTVSANMVVGYIAGVFAVLMTNPLEVVSTRQQLAAKSADTNQQTGLLTSLVKISQEEGVGTFYRGAAANIILAINPAIENTLFDQVKAWFLKTRNLKSLSVGQAFWLGAVAKIVATAVTFPYIRAKVIIQSSSKGSPDNGESKDDAASTSTVEVMKRIAMQDGFLSLWKGMGPQASKAVLSSALMMSARERIEVVTKAAILALIGGSNS